MAAAVLADAPEVCRSRPDYRPHATDMVRISRRRPGQRLHMLELIIEPEAASARAGERVALRGRALWAGRPVKGTCHWIVQEPLRLTDANANPIEITVGESAEPGRLPVELTFEADDKRFSAPAARTYVEVTSLAHVWSPEPAMTVGIVMPLGANAPSAAIELAEGEIAYETRVPVGEPIPLWARADDVDTLIVTSEPGLRGDGRAEGSAAIRSSADAVPDRGDTPAVTSEPRSPDEGSSSEATDRAPDGDAPQLVQQIRGQAYVEWGMIGVRGAGPAHEAGHFVATATSPIGPTDWGDQVLYMPPHLAPGEACEVEIQLTATDIVVEPLESRDSEVRRRLKLRISRPAEAGDPANVTPGELVVTVIGPEFRALPVEPPSRRGRGPWTPTEPIWKPDKPIEAKIGVPAGVVVAGGLIRLRAIGADPDVLTLGCEDETGEIRGLITLRVGGPVTFAWTAADGSFPLGNEGDAVVFRAPDLPPTTRLRARPRFVTIRVSVDDVPGPADDRAARMRAKAPVQRRVLPTIASPPPEKGPEVAEHAAWPPER